MTTSIQKILSVPPVKKLLITLSICIGTLALLTVGSRAIRYLSPSNWVGEIGNAKISTDRFETVKKRIRLQFQLTYASSFSAIEPLIDIDQETWNQLTLLAEAHRRGIHITDKEVINAISKYRFFFRNNRFDPVLYKTILRQSLAVSPKEFEESTRDSLTVEKLYAHITSAVTASEDEALNAYKRKKQLVQLDIIRVAPPQQIPAIHDADALAYYTQHHETFRNPPTIMAEYVKLDFPADGGVQKQVEMKFKAKAIIDTFAKKHDFAAATKQQGFTVEKTPYFSKTNPPEELDIPYTDLLKLFTLRTHAVSEPIKTPRGYVVLHIIEKRPSFIPDFNHAQKRITDILTEKAKQKAALQTATENLQKIQAQRAAVPNTTFAQAATTVGFTPEEIGFTPQEHAAILIGVDTDTASPFYSLETVDQTIAVPTPSAAVIITLKKIQPFDPAAFAKEKGNFLRTFIEEKKDAAFKTFLEELIASANVIAY